MSRLLVDLRNEWEVQALVLLSFTLQVFLVLFAPIRRHNVSTVPRFLLWLAYQMADTTALFALSHMAISSRPHEEQLLMAFWAPFLLVHLGGQDSMTAYSFDDIRLSLRHLQTLIVQVSVASYVVYKYMPSSETLLKVSAALIFMVGILKYGERIWAIRSAFVNFWSTVDKSDDIILPENNRKDKLLKYMHTRRTSIDEEIVLISAHGLLDVCTGPFLDKVPCLYVREAILSLKFYGRLYKLIEMELSLLYDMLYTKSAVIATWYGYCIRVIALVATGVAFVLFQLSRKGGNSTKDVAITYVLLAGGFILELASMARAVGSTWTWVFMYERNWQWLYQEILSLRRLFRVSRHRKWSGFVGQFNLLQSCSKDAEGMPAVIETVNLLWPGLGQIMENWRAELHYSHFSKFSLSTRELVLGEILRIRSQSVDIGPQPGLLTLKYFRLEDSSSVMNILDIDFEDSIMAWHIVSEICMFGDGSGKANLLEAIRVLSNYMMFLLVLRPEMLPGPVRLNRYLRFRKDLVEFMISAPGALPQDRYEWSLRNGFHASMNSYDNPASFDVGVRLADVLYNRHNRLEVIFGVWVEMLCYVANNCSRESHARQLSSGGELITIVWLMARHANLCY